MVKMKSRIFKTFVCIIGMMGMFLLQGCEKELDSLLEYGAEDDAMVKQVDVKVIVPIHPSSLEFFDYCVFYSDNLGMEYRDTIRNSSPDDYYWMKNYSYKTLPILCACEVYLIPKVPRDSEVSFSYIIPKPCFFSRVLFDYHSISDWNEIPNIEGLEILNFDEIKIGSFLSSYGNTCRSTYMIKNEYDGITVHHTK